MRKLLFCAVLFIATPIAARNGQVVQPLRSDYFSQMKIVSVDVNIKDAAIGSVLQLDDRAAQHLERQQQSPDATPSLQSRKSYATLPTVLMLSEIMTDRMRGWNFNKGRDVRLKVSLDTVKLASAPVALVGLPRDTTVLGLLERDRYLGSNDEIGGFVDVYDTVSKQRVGSFYIDVVHRTAGPGNVLTRKQSIRERLAETFSLEAARCLSSPKCKKTKGISL